VLIKYFVDYLVRQEKIYLADIENSFFIYKKLNKKVKLDSTIIKLNYSNESPYTGKIFNTTSIIENNNLYLWFHKETLEIKKYLPVGLLLFRQLVAINANSVSIFEGESNKVVVIKDGVLLASFKKQKISKQDIMLIKEEYLLSSVKIYDKNEYASFLEKSYTYLTYSDIGRILEVNINIKNIFTSLVRWTAFPFLLSAIVISLVLAGYNFYIEEENKSIISNSKKTQVSINKIIGNIKKNKRSNELFTEIHNEFKYASKREALFYILEVNKEMNMTINLIRMSDDNINFFIKTEDESQIPLFVTKLFQKNLFIEVKNISSVKVQKKWTKAQIKAKLKERD